MTNEEIEQAATDAYKDPTYYYQSYRKSGFVAGAKHVLSQQAKGKEELHAKFINDLTDNDNQIIFMAGGNADDVFEWFLPHLNTQKEDWIKLTDDTEPDGEVLAIGYQNCHLIGYIGGSDEEGWQCENDNELLEDVTHWMPLPEPPAII